MDKTSQDDHIKSPTTMKCCACGCWPAEHAPGHICQECLQVYAPALTPENELGGDGDEGWG